MSQYHPKEARWQPHRICLDSELTQSIKTWLLDEGSLTQRLIAISKGNFQVQVRQQHWSYPFPGEARALAMRPREIGLIREVTLLCYGQPWVFARSIIPVNSMRGHLRHLRKWTDESLGELLFKDPAMHRDPFEIARIDASQNFLPADLQSEQTVWGRRSVFFLRNKPILVCEIFLPAFMSSLTVKPD